MQGADVFFGLSAGSSVIDPGDRRPTAHFRRLGDRLRRGAGQPSGSYGGQRGADRLERGAAGQPGDLGQYCEQLERRVGKAHEVMHLMIHKAKDCTRLVFTEKRAGRGKSECGDRHDRLMSDDDRPISSLDRLPGNRDRLQSPSGDQTTSSSGWVSVAFFQTQEWTTCPDSSAGSKPAAATALATLASSRVPWPSGNT